MCVRGRTRKCWTQRRKTENWTQTLRIFVCVAMMMSPAESGYGVVQFTFRVVCVVFLAASFCKWEREISCCYIDWNWFAADEDDKTQQQLERDCNLKLHEIWHLQPATGELYGISALLSCATVFFSEVAKKCSATIRFFEKVKMDAHTREFSDNFSIALALRRPLEDVFDDDEKNIFPNTQWKWREAKPSADKCVKTGAEHSSLSNSCVW